MYNFTETPELEGVYVSAETEQGPKKNSTVHTFKTDDGEVKFWGSTVLDGKLDSVEKHYGFGAKVKIKYLGMVKSKTGTQYKDYDVAAWDESTEVVQQ